MMNTMYGGTKTEMERLLADATKLTGVKYDINNLSDVYNAIHAVQGKLEITGTTAKEASTTLSGSFSAMQSSLTNLMGKLTLGEDIKPALKQLYETTNTFLTKNLLPMIGNVLKGIGEALFDDTIFQGVFDNLKLVIDDLGSKFQSIIDYISNFRDNSNLTIPIIAGLTAGFVAFKTAMAVSDLMDKAKLAMEALKASTIAQTFAQGGLNAVMMLNPFVTVAVAIGLLIAFFIPFQILSVVDFIEFHMSLIVVFTELIELDTALLILSQTELTLVVMLFHTSTVLDLTDSHTFQIICFILLKTS